MLLFYFLIVSSKWDIFLVGSLGRMDVVLGGQFIVFGISNVENLRSHAWTVVIILRYTIVIK